MSTRPHRAEQVCCLAAGLLLTGFGGVRLAEYLAAPAASRAADIQREIFLLLFLFGQLLAIVGAATGLSIASYDLPRGRAALAGAGYGALSSATALLFPRFVGTDYFFLLAFVGAACFTGFCGKLFGRPEELATLPRSSSEGD